MRLFPKPYLLLSSLLIFVCVSCRISKYKHPFESNRVAINEAIFIPILKGNEAVKFKTTLDVLKNHLSGILIVKRTDSASIHLIYVTELGMKLFDFEWKEKKMIAKYVFEPLNKPSLIKALETNLKNIFLLDIYDSTILRLQNKQLKTYYESESFKHRYVLIDSVMGLSTQAVFKGNCKASLINYTYNNYTTSYSQIKCIQYGLVKIHIELNEIAKTND